MNATNAVPASTSNTAGRAAWICLAIAWITFLVPIPGIGLFIGWPLNLVAFILAIVAMSKRGAFGGLWQLLASLIASPIVYLIGMAIFAGTMGALGSAANAGHTTSDQPSAVESAPAETTETVEAVAADAVAVDAATLHRAYAANEIAADELYKGKPLKVTGKVADIASDVSDEPVVSLQVSEFESVHATGLPKDVAAKLAKGQSITVTCVGGGEMVGTPILDDCKL